jgi:hypothetical protein
MMTRQLAGVNKSELDEEVEVITAYQHDIISAVDFLLSGM